MKAFCEAIAELRAQGEGFIQAASSLGNWHTPRSRRLGRAFCTDSKVTRTERGCSTTLEQAMRIDKLQRGFVKVKHSCGGLRSMHPLLVRVDASDGVDSGREVASDERSRTG